MTVAWTPPRSAMGNNFAGLLDRLASRHGIADLDEAGFESFLETPGNAMVLFTEEPDRVAESWDLAVIYPELLAATGTGLRAGLLRPEPGAAGAFRTQPHAGAAVPAQRRLRRCDRGSARLAGLRRRMRGHVAKPRRPAANHRRCGGRRFHFPLG